MWTKFMDMHSGGGLKEAPYQYIFIEADYYEAKVIFYNRFGHNPNRVTCTCCGEDYSIDHYKTILEVTAYERGCAWDEKKKKWVDKPDESKYHRKYVTLEEYKKQEDVLFIYKEDILPAEREGDVPEQGYVWVD